MMKDYFKVGVSNLLHRKLRSWLTMVGIFIGIAAVVGLISLGQGMKEAIGNVFLNIGADKIIVQAKSGLQFAGPPGSNAASNLTTHDVDVVKRVNGVEKAGARLIKPVKLEFSKEVKFYFAASMPDDEEGRELITEVNRYEPESGRLLKKGDRLKAFIGNNVANKGIFKKRIELGNTIKINDAGFEVVGILKKSGNPQQDRVVIAPEDTLRQVLKIEKEKVDVIAVQVQKGVDVSKVAEEIEKAMRRDRDLEIGKEDFEVQTPQQILETLDTILTMVEVVLIGIAAISLLVGGIGIANTMYTAVVERTKEIGIMKSVGAQNKDILLIFIIESGLLGLAGGAIGIALGIGLSKLVEFLAFRFLGTSLIKALFPWYLIAGSLIFSFLVGTASGFFPAKQAASLKPVDALRYE
ncbi:ABC transporter permease [Candidatus Woesearchaeota archaeon]|nr:ABC transporter permease [Candidatus Woesearchaeota archaeon]